MPKWKFQKTGEDQQGLRVKARQRSLKIRESFLKILTLFQLNPGIGVKTGHDP